MVYCLVKIINAIYLGGYMTNKLNMITRFKSSMNPKRYNNLINDKLKKAFLYLLLLSVIIGSIESIKVITMMSSVEKSFQNALRNKELEFEMVDGILNFKSVTFKEEEGQFLLLIDTEKELVDIDSLRSKTVHKDVVTLFLKDGFMFKSESNVRIYKYSELGLDKVYIDNNKIINIINNFKFLKLIMIPIIIIAEYISMIINSFLISMVGVLNVLFSRRKMSFSNILKLSIYSLTMPVIFNIILPIDRYVVLIGGFIIIVALNYININE